MEELRTLEKKVYNCRNCNLREGCTKPVFGRGNPYSDIMLIGEAPGAEEEKQNKPFVGRSGKLLDEMLDKTNIGKENAYITNVVKCRPPGNRTPTRDEKNKCYHFIREQVKILKPIVVVCLGAFAAQAVIDPAIKITKARGQWFENETSKLMPTFHPAATLRDPRKRPLLEQDLNTINDKISNP